MKIRDASGIKPGQEKQDVRSAGAVRHAGPERVMPQLTRARRDGPLGSSPSAPRRPEEEERNMRVTRLQLLAAATVAVLIAWAAPAVDAQPGDLFTPVDEPPPAGPLDDITLRSRVVTIDLGQLDHAQAAVATPPGPTPHTRALSLRTDKQRAAPAPGTTLTLNLFDDTVVTGIVEWTEPTFSGGYAISGRLVDDPLGSLTLVVNDERIVGTVQTSDGTYRIRSVGAGLSTVSEVEEPPLECGVEEPHSETDHQH